MTEDGKGPHVEAGASGDVGGDSISRDEAWFANIKRTYDEYQDVSLTSARRSQAVFDQVSNVAVQALQNAVETANMLGKQAVAHRDIAIDHEWNKEIGEGAAEAAILRAVGRMLAGRPDDVVTNEADAS